MEWTQTEKAKKPAEKAPARQQQQQQPQQKQINIKDLSVQQLQNVGSKYLILLWPCPFKYWSNP